MRRLRAAQNKAGNMHHVGVSPNGKARGFGSRICRFESYCPGLAEMPLCHIVMTLLRPLAESWLKSRRKARWVLIEHLSHYAWLSVKTYKILCSPHRHKMGKWKRSERATHIMWLRWQAKATIRKQTIALWTVWVYSRLTVGKTIIEISICETQPSISADCWPWKAVIWGCTGIDRGMKIIISLDWWRNYQQTK